MVAWTGLGDFLKSSATDWLGETQRRLLERSLVADP
jgi:hypothetical protein